MKTNIIRIIKSMIREIQAMDDELFVYAHLDQPWIEVSVSKFEFYMHNEDFKKLCTKWHKVFKNLGVNLIFVCGWVPKEESLVELAENNNLILS